MGPRFRWPIRHGRCKCSGKARNACTNGGSADTSLESLLSLPYLGFLDKHHPAYVATRKILLSAKNPYYAAGEKFRGVGYDIFKKLFRK
jgi:hypothetical protein